MTPTGQTTSQNQMTGIDVSHDRPFEREEATTLHELVDEMLETDRRFVGLSRYVTNINFYWSYQISTACAGHGFIFFNPDFYDSIPVQTRKTVVAHEIWHLILKHLDRMQDMDPDLANEAADHAINLGLKTDGFTFDGTTPCMDERFRGMSSEAIYQVLVAEKKKKQNQKGGAGGKPQAVQDAPTADQIEDLIKQVLEDQAAKGDKAKDIQQQAEENEDAVDEAMKGVNPGNSPGGESILLQTNKVEVRIKTASYGEIFENYLVDPLSGGKRTFMRPSRRQVKGSTLRLPGKYPRRGKKNRLTHLVYALDVSGSISGAQRTQFLRSAATIKKMLNPELMTIILWDTRITYEKVFREDESLDNIRIQAGGGTDLKPVFKRVEQINPEALVIFTDLEVGIPNKPDWDVIWFVPDMNCRIPQGLNYGDLYLVPMN